MKTEAFVLLLDQRFKCTNIKNPTEEKLALVNLKATQV